MYFTYLNFPAVPKYLEDQILSIVENPIQNFHDSQSQAFAEYMTANSDELHISASQEVLDAISNVEIDYATSLGYPLSEASEHFKELAHFDFLEVNHALREWAKEFIDPNVAHVSIQVMYGGTTITPHIDEMRSYAYNYVISTGGNSKTCFYKPKEEFNHLTTHSQTIFPFERLDKVEEVQIEAGRWHRLETTKIHSVIDLDPTLKRISLSLSFI